MSMRRWFPCVILSVQAKDNIELVQRTIQGETSNDATLKNAVQNDPSAWSTMQLYQHDNKHCLTLVDAADNQNKILKEAACGNNDEQMFQFTKEGQLKSKTGICAANDGETLSFVGCNNNANQKFEFSSGNTISRSGENPNCWTFTSEDKPISYSKCGEGSQQFFFATRTNSYASPYSVKLSDEWVLLYMQNRLQQGWESSTEDASNTITNCPYAAAKCSNLGNLKVLKPDGSIDFKFKIRYNTNNDQTTSECVWFQNNNPLQSGLATSGFYKTDECADDFSNFEGLRPNSGNALMMGSSDGNFEVGSKKDTIRFKSDKSDATRVSLFIKRDKKYDWTLLLVQKYESSDTTTFATTSDGTQSCTGDEKFCDNLGSISALQGSRNFYHLKLERTGIPAKQGASPKTKTLEWVQDKPPTGTHGSDLKFEPISGFDDSNSAAFFPFTGLRENPSGHCLMQGQWKKPSNWWQCVGRKDAKEANAYPGMPWEGNDANDINLLWVATSLKLWIKSEEADKMACTDILEGFIDYANRDSIEGYIKSCPQNSPYVNKDKKCAGTVCRVDPDRATCCRTAECKCPNGEALTGDKCTQDGATKCDPTKCDKGYHSDGDECKENICVCTGGDHAVGKNANEQNKCLKNGDEHCTTCKNGYREITAMGENKKCAPNTCKCTYGTAKSLENGFCPKHDSEDCYACTNENAYTKTKIDNRDVCEPITCSDTTVLDNYKTKPFNNDKCSDVKTEGTCTVSCAAGYSGNPTGTKTFTCSKNGKLTANDETELKCDPDTCNNKNTDFGENTEKTCDGTKTNEKCTVKCANGYCAAEGTPSTTEWTCSANGFEGGKKLECSPCPCNNVNAQPENGKWTNTCGPKIESGGKCDVTCDDGHELKTPMKCENGNFETAKCEPKTCDASTAPDNGKTGECAGKQQLKSGEQCSPTCDSPKYKLDKPTTCNKGVLSAGKCVPTRKCRLQWGHACGTNTPYKGYWSDTMVTYSQCERFCNDKYWELKNNNVIVSACELAATQDATTDEQRKSIKGAWCFAHTGKDTKCGTTQQGFRNKPNAGATCIDELDGK